jgi:hypothetical protein
MLHRTYRPALRTTLVLALAALLALAPAGALASPRDRTPRALLATERYYSSYGATAAPTDPTQGAQAAERYYSSYGRAEPLAAPTTPATAATDGGPSWTAAILGSALLILAAAGLGVLAGRTTMRPRRRTA